MRVIPCLSFALLPAALLAGCAGGAPAPAPSPTATATAGGYVAKVAALSSGQREGVLLRAIRDADRPCQTVVAEQKLPAPDTGAAWLATCDDHSRWVVAIADNGTATVADAHDLAPRH